MSTIYVTAHSDQMDLICYRHYGQQAGAVEQVLTANPHAADEAHCLPAGVKLVLPDLAAETQTLAARLWD
ncbi:tail protein X [Pseudooceanicola sp. HF7]|uniref:tail protein X n=1 Tax=Pseudooceanicola sp. HF7 TaxID=2721560 RepID=UPI00142F6F1A|nr:tail protein X [Pseudooceanicola sp. HF7]NIZ11099.1 phage tail protein [Pseudooceanicola sp. HF7]